MKRIISFILICVMLSLSLVGCGEKKSGIKDPVYVTVVLGDGSFALARQAVPLSDANGDGALTADDALRIAHEKHHPSGAEGYGSESSAQYGSSLTRLWGVENGGSYGYYLNNGMIYNLDATVKVGDHIVAFIYQDTVTWSDTYAYFNVSEASLQKGESLTLTLSAFTSFDENWNPIAAPLAGATLTVNGEALELVTDAEGKVSISFDKKGTYTVSASLAGTVLIPPVCTVTVK